MEKIKKFIFLLLIIFLYNISNLSCTGFKDDSNEPSENGYQSDFLLIIDKIKEVHPGENTEPLQFMSESEFEILIQNTYVKLADISLKNNFYYIVKEFLARMLDGHTNLYGNDKLFIEYNDNGTTKSMLVSTDFSKTYQPDIGRNNITEYEAGNSFHEFNGGDVIATIRPIGNGLTFFGDIYVLTSPHSFSSATFFVVSIKDNNLGTIIGKPSGNNSIRYGYSTGIDLPYTGFYFNTSIRIWGRSKPGIIETEEFIEPDINVNISINDYIYNLDPVWEYLDNNVF